MADRSSVKETNTKGYLQRTDSVLPRLLYVPIGDGQWPLLRSVSSDMKKTNDGYLAQCCVREYDTAHTHTACYISRCDTVYFGTFFSRILRFSQTEVNFCQTKWCHSPGDSNVHCRFNNSGLRNAKASQSSTFPFCINHNVKIV